MTEEQRKKFLYRDCEKFNDTMTYEEYENAVKKYLMLCDWHYSEDGVEKRMKNRKWIVEEGYKNRETVGDIAMDIGFCG